MLPLRLEPLADHTSVTLTSALFAAGMAVFAVVSAVSGKLIERVTLLVTGAAAFMLSATALVVTGLVGSAYVISGCFLVFMIGQLILYIVARRGIALVPEERVGRAFGAFGVLSDLGYVLGPRLAASYYAARILHLAGRRELLPDLFTTWITSTVFAGNGVVAVE